MDLLNKIPLVHEEYNEDIQQIILDYHKYLNEQEMKEEANK